MSVGQEETLGGGYLPIQKEVSASEELVGTNGFLTDYALKKVATKGVCLRVMRSPDEFGKTTTGDAHTIYDQFNLQELPGATNGEKYFNGLVIMSNQLNGERNLSDRSALITEPSSFTDGSFVGGYEREKGTGYFPFGKMGQLVIPGDNYLTKVNIPEGDFGEEHRKQIATSIQKSICDILSKDSNQTIAKSGGEKPADQTGEKKNLAEEQWEQFAKNVESAWEKIYEENKDSKSTFLLEFVKRISNKIVAGDYQPSVFGGGYFENVNKIELPSEDQETCLSLVLDFIQKAGSGSKLINDEGGRESDLNLDNPGETLEKIKKGVLTVYSKNQLGKFHLSMNDKNGNLFVSFEIDKVTYEAKKAYDEKEFEESMRQEIHPVKPQEESDPLDQDSYDNAVSGQRAFEEQQRQRQIDEQRLRN